MKTSYFSFTLTDIYDLSQPEILEEAQCCAERQVEFLFPEYSGTVRPVLYATVESAGTLGKVYHFYGYLE